MKNKKSIKNAVSLLLCVFMVVSMMISAAAEEMALDQMQNSPDSMTFGECRTEISENGDICREIYLDLNYVNQNPDIRLVTDGVEISFGEDSGVTSWELNSDCRMSGSACKRDRETGIVTTTNCYTVVISVVQTTMAELTVYARAANGVTADKTYAIPENDGKDDTNSGVPGNKQVLLSGDMDGNGRITANDAMKMMRYSIKLEKFTEEQLIAADVNLDGRVNAKDSLATLRYTIGFNDPGTVFSK